MTASSWKTCILTTVYVSFGRKEMGVSTYIPTYRLSYRQAIAFVREGGSVIAVSRRSAYRLASSVGYGGPIERHPAHSNKITGTTYGYRRHYHTEVKAYSGGHIFYVW